MTATQTPFADGKAPDAMRTIGEVAAALGIKQHILRYWEQQFPSLRPLKRSGGRRLYRPQDVERLCTIDRLVNHEGYTIKGAKAALAALERPSRSPIAGEESVQDMKVRLQSIRDRLAGALQAA